MLHRDFLVHAALAGVAVEGYVFRLAIKFRQFVQLIRLSVFSRICKLRAHRGHSHCGARGLSGRCVGRFSQRLILGELFRMTGRGHRLRLYRLRLSGRLAICLNRLFRSLIIGEFVVRFCRGRIGGQRTRFGVALERHTVLIVRTGGIGAAGRGRIGEHRRRVARGRLCGRARLIVQRLIRRVVFRVIVIVCIGGVCSGLFHAGGLGAHVRLGYAAHGRAGVAQVFVRVVTAAAAQRTYADFVQRGRGRIVRGRVVGGRHAYLVQLQHTAGRVGKRRHGVALRRV